VEGADCGDVDVYATFTVAPSLTPVRTAPVRVAPVTVYVRVASKFVIVNWP
jgi:hypothetical protein